MSLKSQTPPRWFGERVQPESYNMEVTYITKDTGDQVVIPMPSKFHCLMNRDYTSLFVQDALHKKDELAQYARWYLQQHKNIIPTEISLKFIDKDKYNG